MDFLDIAKKRQSTRKYDASRFVEEEKLENILEAGRLSPSARNTQPWRLYASIRKDVIDEINASFEALGRNLFFKACK